MRYGRRWNFDRAAASMALSAESNRALSNFNHAAMAYTESIADAIARKYAHACSALLLRRIRSDEKVSEPPAPGLFEPSRRLICDTLESLLREHFPELSHK